MVSAMQRSDLEPVIIEDLVRIGMDQGFEHGIEQGLERGIEQGLERGIEQGLERGIEQGLERGRNEMLEQVRQQLRDLLRTRALKCAPDEDNRIDSETSLAKLLHWITLAVTAKNVRQILDG
jgi:flagellar biosynthesis/type III secretory pathway protein FliH